MRNDEVEYYVSKLIDKNQVLEVIDWCIDQFGEPSSRWVYVNQKLYFRNNMELYLTSLRFNL